MNNSKIVFDDLAISIEDSADIGENLREMESRIVRIIETIGRIKSSDDWSTLKSLIFDAEVEGLEKRLRQEAEQLNLNHPQINFLQGKLSWARKYADLDKLIQEYRLELSRIRKLTQPTER